MTIIDAGVVTAIAPAFQPTFHAFLSLSLSHLHTQTHTHIHTRTHTHTHKHTHTERLTDTLSHSQVTIIDAGVVTAIAPAFQPTFHAFLLDLCQGRPVYR